MSTFGAQGHAAPAPASLHHQADSSVVSPVMATTAPHSGLNTEMRAQARREREAMRERRSREKMQQSSSGAHLGWGVGGTHTAAGGAHGGSVATHASGGNSGGATNNSGTSSSTSNMGLAGSGSAPAAHSSSVTAIINNRARSSSTASSNLTSSHRPHQHQHSHSSSISALQGSTSVGAAHISDRRISPNLTTKKSDDSNKGGTSSISAASAPRRAGAPKKMPRHVRRISTSSTTSEVAAPLNPKKSSSSSQTSLRQPLQQQQQQQPGSSPVLQQRPEYDSAGTVRTEKMRSSASDVASGTTPSAGPSPMLPAIESYREGGHLPHVDSLMARLESPPKLDEQQDGEHPSPSAVFAQHYYELIEKCKKWQRYGSSMKARTETLEIETRYLRGANQKRDSDIRALELQMEGMRRTVLMLEDEIRRSGSRYGQTSVTRDHYSSSMEAAAAAAAVSSAGQQPGSNNMYTATALRAFDAGMAVPSPPISAHPSHSCLDGYKSNSSLRSLAHPGLSSSTSLLPMRVDHYRTSDYLEHSQDQRPPTPHSGASIPASLRLAMQPGDRKASSSSLGLHDEEHYLSSQAHGVAPSAMHQARHHCMRQDGTVSDMLASGHAAPDPISRREEVERQHYEDDKTAMYSSQGHALSSSHTYPPGEAVESEALTISALAAMDRQRPESNRLPSASSAPVLRPAPLQAPSHQHDSLKRGLSEADSGAAMSCIETEANGHNLDSSAAHAWQRATHGQERMHRSFDDVATEQSLLSGTHKKDFETERGSQSALGLLGEPNSTAKGSRSGSVQSDALTVTEDYLQGIVQQKRRLRKISQSQQQQLQYLQARVHLDPASTHGRSRSSSHGSHSENSCSKISSRPSSRLSNRAPRQRSLSRAGSFSVHDTIPVSKDDVFSHDSTTRQPLGNVDANAGRVGTLSALELRHYGQDHDGADSDGSADIEGAKARQREKEAGLSTTASAPGLVASAQGGGSTPPSPPDAAEGGEDDDPKGAHRRLYLRLRNELSTPDIVRFERYVHRYDALEIGMGGSRGIINRVRRLLLPDDVVKAKASNPDLYRFRKELAREFERIVREDAVPVSSNTNYVSGTESTLEDGSHELSFAQQQQQQH